MATVVTGRDVTLTIGAVTYDAQALAGTLTIEENRETYETLAGRVEKHLDEVATLEVELLLDWGVVGGLAVTLWSAADDAPDTTLAFTLAVDGESWAGDVYPVKPPVGGEGNSATTATLTLPVKGKPTHTAKI